MNDTPLVTCLCLTMAGRQDFLRRAIDCFIAQTYNNRELLIVADSVDNLDRDCALVVAVYKDIDILIPSSKRSIGQKRNAGCESARGDIIAIWDDDDYYAPRRLESQVAWLTLNPSAKVAGVFGCHFTDGNSWWKFENSSKDSPHVVGSSLCFYRDWWSGHRFDEGQYGMIGEDSRFATEAYEARKLLRMPPGTHLMYATIHPGNTSKKTPVGPGWTPLPGFEWHD